MTINEYQEFTRTTAIYPADRAMEYLTCGLASEVGEYLGKWKKIIRDKSGKVDVMESYELAKEAGDILWYVSRLCDEQGWDLQDVIDINVEKLSSRQDRDALQGSGDDR